MAAEVTHQSALIIVDVQLDFCQGGPLAVPGGDEVVPVINELRASGKFDVVVVSCDWHPIDHTSFACNHPGAKAFSTVRTPKGEALTVWPVHCVQYSKGASLHPDLERSPRDIVVCKGYDRDFECFSACGTAEKPTELVETLRKQNVSNVTVVGLAYDYCVGETCLDLAKAGFTTTLLKEATRYISEESAKVMAIKLCKAVCCGNSSAATWPCTGRCAKPSA